MMSVRGQVDGVALAKYRKGKFTLTCKVFQWLLLCNIS